MGKIWVPAENKNIYKRDHRRLARYRSRALDIDSLSSGLCQVLSSSLKLVLAERGKLSDSVDAPRRKESIPGMGIDPTFWNWEREAEWGAIAFNRGDALSDADPGRECDEGM